jgi:splicing factor 3B subunit 2
MAAQRAAAAPEDFSDLVAEQATRAKRKADAKKKDSDAKKFKF